MKREKLIKLLKINLIYDLKLKFNDIRRTIRRKASNLTQNFEQNDPINDQIKAFNFAFGKTKIQSSSSEVFSSLNEMLISRTP